MMLHARRSLWIIVAAAVLGLFAATIVGTVRGSEYRAEVSYVVTTGEGDVLADAEVQPLVQTLASSFESRRVASEVVDRLALDRSVTEVQEGLAMRSRPQSSLLVGSFQDGDRETAEQILEAASSAFLASAVESGISGSPTGDGPDVRVELFSPAETLPDPVSRPLWLIAAIGALVGLIVGIGIVALGKAIRPRIDSAADADDVLGAAALDLTGPALRDRAAEALRGILPAGRGGAVVVCSPDSAASERERFVQSAVAGLGSAAWEVALIRADRQAEDPRDDADASDPFFEDLPVSSSLGAGEREPGALQSVRPELNLDVGQLALAPPEKVERAREALQDLLLRSDLVVVDAGAAGSRLQPIGDLTQAVVLVVALGVTTKREASELARELAAWWPGPTRAVLVEGDIPRLTF